GLPWWGQRARRSGAAEPLAYTRRAPGRIRSERRCAPSPMVLPRVRPIGRADFSRDVTTAPSACLRVVDVDRLDSGEEVDSFAPLLMRTDSRCLHAAERQVDFAAQRG